MELKYCTPFISVPMPLTGDGKGPANASQTVLTVYEVWDGSNETVCGCSDKDTADLIAVLLNQYRSRKPKVDNVSTPKRKSMGQRIDEVLK